MQVAYYKADKTTSAKIRELMDGWDAVKQQAKALAREYGADTRSLYYKEFWGRTWVSAFIFKSPPDEKVWRRVKDTSDGWRPRRKRGSPYREFDKLVSTFIDDICKVVGEPMWHAGSVFTPGIIVRKDAVYLALSIKAKGHGCRRITDLTFEKARKPTKKGRRS